MRRDRENVMAYQRDQNWNQRWIVSRTELHDDGIMPADVRLSRSTIELS